MLLTFALITLLVCCASKASAGERERKLEKRAHHQRATLHADRGSLRFCRNHPKAKVFCTSRRLRFIRARIGWTRRELAETRARLETRRWEAMNGDFEVSVRILSRRLGVSSLAGWVLSCADSEGGRGKWVPNRNGSGAGGWMQFLSGTYYSNSPAAWRFAASRRVFVPRRYDSWYSPIGQALTALWMFHNEGSGQWYGSGC